MKKRILLGVCTACLALLLVAEPALAQRGGGRGGGGGGRGGGGRGYAGRGYYGGGYNRGFYGGYGRGFYGGLGYGLGYGVGGYGYGYPYYGDSYYSYAPSYYYPDYGYAYSASAPYYDTSGPSYAANPPTGSYQSFYSGPTQNRADPNAAQIRVVVPRPDAQVMFDGTQTRQQGTDRVFMTPSLPAGKESHYTVTASWTENGQQVNRERRINVTPGSQVLVNFADDTRKNAPNPNLQVPQNSNPGSPIPQPPQ